MAPGSAGRLFMAGMRHRLGGERSFAALIRFPAEFRRER